MRYLLAIVLLLFSAGSRSQQLVLATYQYAENTRLENIRPLSKYLSDSLGLSVVIKSYPTVPAFIEGIQQDEVDIALINTFGYLLLESARTSFRMRPYAVLKVPEGAADNYKTAFLARQDFAADSLAGLLAVAPTTRLGLVNVGSTSGNLLPRLKLAATGIDSPEQRFQSVIYCGNHRQAVEMLLEEKLDICAVGSTEYFNLMADKERAGRVKLLWLSPEIPLGPVLLHNRISGSLRKKILTLLLTLDESLPPALEAVKAGWSEAKQAEKYIPIDKSFYNYFRRQFGRPEVMERILRQFAN